MRKELEFNSITYSNPQTNKSNIAQGQKAFYVTESKTKKQAIKDLPHFIAYSISKLFPVKLYDSRRVAWKHLSVAEPAALTSGVRVSQALPVCGFSQDPLPVGMSAPLLSPHQLRMLLLPSKSFLKPEEKKKRSVSMHGSLIVKKEIPLNIPVLYIWLGFINSLPFNSCLFVEVRKC